MAHSQGKVAVQFSMKKNTIVVGILAPGAYFSPALLSGGHFNNLLFRFLSKSTFLCVTTLARRF